MAGTRPGGVTLVAVLSWISGALSIIGGVVILVNAGPAALGWIAIIIGVVTILVSLGLFRGSNVSRIIVTIVFVLNIVNAVIQLIAQPGGWAAAVGSAVIALIGLFLLYTQRANEFFRS